MMKKGVIMKKRYIILYALAAMIVLGFGYFQINGWLKSRPSIEYAVNQNPSAAPAYPDVRFAVISDTHMYDHSLGVTGSAFEAVMNSDRKQLRESGELMDYAINEILRSDAQFVLISGDLTKDGELINHEVLTKKLSRLTGAGKKVYVVPGNHDINILHSARSYSGASSTLVDTVTQEEFTRLYADFGYGEALYRDAGTLSYVAEPADGLWLLGIDACRYMENRPGVYEMTGGKVSQSTSDWIVQVLQEAQRQNKAVIALMHHGAAEHWKGQGRLHPEYLIDDYTHFGRMLASYGVRLVFTGHYHAQDITLARFKEGYIYDIQTGSLVTAPCPIRYVTLRDNVLTLQSEFIIDKIRPGTDYAETAAAFVKETVKREAFDTLKRYRVSDADAEIIADAVGDAFSAHYAGDEDETQRPRLATRELSLWGRVVLFAQQYVLDGLWRDLYPADNHVTLTMD
jgi:3',5'-cyclic AMP phosphodiesterase CpdA